MKLPASAINLIETWRLGFVATVAADGTPNVSPKGTFIVIDAETVAFGEMRSPNTMKNLKSQPQVEVNFVNILTRKGVRIRGTTTVLTAGDSEFKSLLPQFSVIWGNELCSMFNAIVKIPVETVKPLQSPIYEIGGNEAELSAQWKDKIGSL